MIDRLMYLEEGTVAITADRASTNIIDLYQLKDAFGNNISQDMFNDAANLVVEVTVDGVGASGNSILTTLDTADDAAFNDNKVSYVIKDDIGNNYDVGTIYNGTVPIPLKRFVRLYFEETGTVTALKIRAWIAHPLTSN
jgi:hypothetical protein